MFTNSITVFESLDGNTVLDHENNFRKLSIKIDALRTDLSNKGFFIPRFTYEFSSKTGFDVKRYVTVTDKNVPENEDATELVEGQPVINSINGKRARSNSITENLGKSEPDKTVKRSRI